MAKPGEKFYLDARGIKASGIVTEAGFTVFKGSEVRPSIAKYLNKTLVDLGLLIRLDTNDSHIVLPLSFIVFQDHTRLVCPS